jgi:hypothetical protein
MGFLMKLILILLFPLLFVGRILNSLLRRDPLRVRKPKGTTYWIERGLEPSRTSYFSEASALEGSNHGGFGWLTTVALGWVARLVAPPRKSTGEDFRVAAERDQTIPDEVYTLW